jgi:cob(I)alamin adenosyltransferase
MVRLTKIYTKTGDDGTTGLIGGGRVRKDDLRVEAYGTVDEANAALGLAVVACEQSVEGSAARALAEVLRSTQHDLFDLGADLALPIVADETPGAMLRVTAAQVTRLEEVIDMHNDRLAPLTSFVLPGGTPAAAALHLARTVVRRAERLAVTLRLDRPAEVNEHALHYLNRLSDLLFVLARVANEWSARDVLWVPGKSRKA